MMPLVFTPAFAFQLNHQMLRSTFRIINVTGKILASPWNDIYYRFDIVEAFEHTTSLSENAVGH